MDDSVITCDEIIDAQAKSNNEERKLISKNFNEKNIYSVKCKICLFYWPFHQYHYMNYSCKYLLLSDIILS